MDRPAAATIDLFMNSTARPTSPPPQPTAQPLWLNLLVGGACVAAMAWLRLYALPDRITPIGYGVPLFLFIWLGDRRVLWGGVAAFTLISVLEIFVVLPASTNPIFRNGEAYRAAAFIMVLVDLLFLSISVDWLITTQLSLVRRNVELDRANHELTAREEEIARQNEELQSQTEELERQTEELRVGNEELARRETTLEGLLSLSRSLVAEMGESAMMDQICQSLAELINGTGLATAIIEVHGDEVAVICHHGFGEGGIASEHMPLRNSFASLIVERGRTGFIEDLAARPDLTVPQPKDGQGVKSVLSSPLRVRGRGVGTIEVYSREPRKWTEAQITLLESLSAQAAISIESTTLFGQIEQERQRLAALLNTAPIGLVITQPDWPQLVLNPTASLLFSVPQGTLITAHDLSAGNRLFQEGRLLSAEQWPIARACVQGEAVVGEEVELFSASGRRYNLLVSAAPVRDARGQRIGAVSTYAEITQLKGLQRELDFRRREAEEASVRKSRFLAAVSHDIRTPANAISLLAELMQRSAVNPALQGEVPEIAADLKRSAMTLVDLVSDVLDLTRFDAGRIDLHETEFSLSEMIREECRSLLQLAREKGVGFECICPDDRIIIRADRVKLSRILGNLINNAIKFTEQGSVTITTRRLPDGQIGIDVADTGRGIAPENQARIFDEFVQVRAPGRDISKGSGLGLAICRRLIEAMGGRINVQSALGQGSTFSVVLPASVVAPT
jgi:signal transduction histidine kinase